MDEDSIINLAVIISSAFLFGLYHAYLFYVFKHSPRKTIYGLTSSARRVFVASIMYRKDAILAVQTLRNWIMAASALASTSIVIVIGLAAFLSAVGQVTVDSTGIDSNPIKFNSLLNNWFPVKIVCLIITLMTAFFMFAQAMRFFNHVCIVINVNISDEELGKLDKHARLAYLSITPDFVGDLMNRAAFYNTSGLRMYYLTFPLIAWVGGPWYLIGATIILLIILRQLDFNTNISKRDLDASKKSDEESSPEDLPHEELHRRASIEMRSIA